MMLRTAATSLALLFLMGVLWMPTAHAQEAHPAGVVLDASSPDVAVEVRTMNAVQVCYIDDNGNGRYGVGEPVILRTRGSCSDTSSGSDLRLANWGGLEAGRRLGNAADAGVQLSNPSRTISFYYFDADGDGRMDHGDTVYVNIAVPENNFVDVGDIRLSPFGDRPAGEPVRGGDPDLSSGLTLLGTPSEAIGHVDMDGDNVYGSQDILYLNSDEGGNELVEFGDLRLQRVDDDRPFGSFVRLGDADGAALMTDIVRRPCYTDEDASGSYTEGDHLYLDLDARCTGALGAGDVRLSASDLGGAGSRIAAGDPDDGRNSKEVAQAGVSFVDIDADGSFTQGDVLFVDLVSVSSNRVDAGDLRLTPLDGNGGVVVTSDASDVGRSLVVAGTFEDLLGFIPVAGGESPSVDDPIYLNIDDETNEGVEPGDVRLVPIRDLPFGGIVHLGTGEVLPRLVSSSAQVCANLAGSSKYSAGDAVYLAMSGGCDDVDVGDIRLTAVGAHAAGTVVLATDGDVGADLDATSGTPRWKYFDADGDSEWGQGDTLYVDLVRPTDDQVDVGDLRITAFGDHAAMAAVSSGENDVSLGLRLMGNIGAHVDFVDGDDTGDFTPSDIAYVNVDATGTYVSILDVRLVALPQRTTSEDPTETDTTTATDTDTETETVTETETDTATATEDEETVTETDTGTEGPVRTPAPGILLTLLSILALTAFTRQRRT